MAISGISAASTKNAASTGTSNSASAAYDMVVLFVAVFLKLKLIMTNYLNYFES